MTWKFIQAMDQRRRLARIAARILFLPVLIMSVAVAVEDFDEGAHTRVRPPSKTGLNYFSTISFLRLVTKAIRSSFSALGTLNLSSVATRCFAAASQSLPVMPRPLCELFMSRPV